jgi:hypothetical protein
VLRDFVRKVLSRICSLVKRIAEHSFLIQHFNQINHKNAIRRSADENMIPFSPMISRPPTSQLPWLASWYGLTLDLTTSLLDPPPFRTQLNIHYIPQLNTATHCTPRSSPTLIVTSEDNLHSPFSGESKVTMCPPPSSTMARNLLDPR